MSQKPRDRSQVVELEPHGPDTFVGESPPYEWGRIYGGLVVAQALWAATQTVRVEHAVHSLHAYFILGEIAPLTPEVLGGLSSVLRCDPSVYVRTNAAGALGFVGIRGLAEGGLSAPPLLLLLLGEVLEMLVPILTRPSRPGAFDWDFPVFSICDLPYGNS